MKQITGNRTAALLLSAMIVAMAWLVVPSSARAANTKPTGRLTKYTTTWNGLPRYYAVYVPKNLQPNSAMVLFLNATSANPATSPPYFGQLPWELLADQERFLMVFPLSSYNSRASQWYWDCDFMDFSFPIWPDDVGYLRWIVNTLVQQYTINPDAVFVSGMSSGGFMAHRAGIEMSDLVAAIAPVSGMVEIEQVNAGFVLSEPAEPISVLDLHGDADTTIPLCGGVKGYWKESKLAIPSIDASMGFWRTANGCTDSVPTICVDGTPAPGVMGLDATHCTNGVEVEFIREPGVGHKWMPGTETTVWTFFSTHVREPN